MEFVKTFVKSVRAVLIARLREFYRDKAAFYWHLFLPCFIIASFYFIFGSSQTPAYKVGVITIESESGSSDVNHSHRRETRQFHLAASLPRSRNVRHSRESGNPPIMYATAARAGQIEAQSSDIRFETEQTLSALSQSRTRLNPYLPSLSQSAAPASSAIPHSVRHSRESGNPPIMYATAAARAGQIAFQGSDIRFETEQTLSALFHSRTRLNPYLPSLSQSAAPVPSAIPRNVRHSRESGNPPIMYATAAAKAGQTTFQGSNYSEEFFQLKYIQFIPQKKEEGLNKIRNHNLDMLIQPGLPLQYWVNDSNRKAYFLEKILKGSYSKPIQKMPSLARDVSYVDWVFPGILALNIMFSCLWGVGWLMVKYRDDGYLKRLHATPLKVYHFILGQMLARLLIIFCGTGLVFVVGSWAIDFEMQGSYLDLAVCYLLGVLSLISVGLFVAVRTTSKEFADGVLNLFSWPMIIFSGMWFSLEGASSWILAFAYSLPLTHLVESTRKIMLEGSMLSELWLNVSAMAIFSIVMFTVVSVLFKWNDK